MESMVNSDNVVRGGCTPKYKDTKTLVEMLKYEFKEIVPKPGVKVETDAAIEFCHYPTGFAEFRVSHLKIAGAGE